MGAAAVAVMVRREKDIVTLFRSAGAVNAAAAKPLGALGLEESHHLARLQRENVIRSGPPGTWYLDEAAWTERTLKRRRIGLVFLVVSLFALALGLGLLPATRP
jgi:hypothetical protein